jgi:hypothetical protein
MPHNLSQVKPAKTFVENWTEVDATWVSCSYLGKTYTAVIRQPDFRPVAFFLAALHWL